MVPNDLTATSETVLLSAKVMALANLHHHQQNNCITVLTLSGNMMTFENNCGKNSVIKSKWNGNLGINETDMVGIKITDTKYLICIK